MQLAQFFQGAQGNSSDWLGSDSNFGCGFVQDAVSSGCFQRKPTCCHPFRRSPIWSQTHNLVAKVKELIEAAAEEVGAGRHMTFWHSAWMCQTTCR